MQVKDGMSTLVLTVGPDHTLAQVASAMSDRRVGAAVVVDPDQPGPGIITERDILQSLGSGQDPAEERVGAHLSTGITFAEPGWSLEYAAEAMVRGGFRHLVVIDGGELIGVLSMRDIVRCWTQGAGKDAGEEGKAPGATEKSTGPSSSLPYPDSWQLIQT